MHYHAERGNEGKSLVAMHYHAERGHEGKSLVAMHYHAERVNEGKYASSFLDSSGLRGGG